MSDKETRDEERQRIARIKRATCLGCLAAAMGQPLHTVAESGFAARSYEGDAWEAGWEFMNGSATWLARSAEHQRLAQAIRIALGDLLICADNFDDEAGDTAEVLHGAAKAFGLDVSAYDEQIATAVKKLHSFDD